MNNLNVLNASVRRDFLQTDTEGSNGVLELYQHIVDYTRKYLEIDFGTIIDVKATDQRFKVHDSRCKIQDTAQRIQNPGGRESEGRRQRTEKALS